MMDRHTTRTPHGQNDSYMYVDACLNDSNEPTRRICMHAVHGRKVHQQGVHDSQHKHGDDSTCLMHVYYVQGKIDENDRKRCSTYDASCATLVALDARASHIVAVM